MSIERRVDIEVIIAIDDVRIAYRKENHQNKEKRMVRFHLRYKPLFIKIDKR